MHSISPFSFGKPSLFQFLLLHVSETGKFLPKEWAAAPAWTQNIVLDALAMGRDQMSKLLISDPNASLDMPRCCRRDLLVAALGVAGSVRVATKLQPGAEKGMHSLLSRVGSNSKAIAQLFQLSKKQFKRSTFRPPFVASPANFEIAQERPEFR
jgi:hypothetical protein